MPDRDQVIKGLECCVDYPEKWADDCGEHGCPYVKNGRTCMTDLQRDALSLLKAQELNYPVCERCGKQIGVIEIDVFNYDGSDSVHLLPIDVYDEITGCVTFTTSPNWCGYELTDEERKARIRCPHCGEYPFDTSAEIEVYEPVNVMMWTSRQTETQKEAIPWAKT